MSQKFSLSAQIEECERELKQRASVYPRLVGKGSLRQAEADFLVARMRAVKATLEWLQENESAVREFVSSNKKGPTEAGPE